MTFYLYVYMVAIALLTSAGCAYYAFKLGNLKTTYTGPWYTMSVGFTFGVIYEVFKMYFYLDILNFLYEFRIEALLVGQVLETLKYAPLFVAFAIMYERRKNEERPT